MFTGKRRAKFQKRVTSVAFQSNLRKQIRKLPKILKSDSMKIIQYYSILFNRVLRGVAREEIENLSRRSSRVSIEAEAPGAAAAPPLLAAPPALPFGTCPPGL